MDEISFNIKKWVALYPETKNIKKWEYLASQQDLCIGVYNDNPVNLIPAAQRRRMSSLSKMALQSALLLHQQSDIDYIIFASRHGELTRTITLLENITAGDDASPILFSQSVHNTAAGLFTIASKLVIPVCSLAAGENTLHNGLIEAFCYLQDNLNHTVLIINFDEPLPTPYHVFENQQYQGFSFGLLLETGTQFTVKALSESLEKESSVPQAFACIDYLINEKKTMVLRSQKRSWLWEKN